MKKEKTGIGEGEGRTDELSVRRSHPRSEQAESVRARGRRRGLTPRIPPESSQNRRDGRKDGRTDGRLLYAHDWPVRTRTGTYEYVGALFDTLQ